MTSYEHNICKYNSVGIVCTPVLMSVCASLAQGLGGSRFVAAGGWVRGGSQFSWGWSPLQSHVGWAVTVCQEWGGEHWSLLKWEGDILSFTPGSILLSADPVNYYLGMAWEHLGNICGMSAGGYLGHIWKISRGFLGDKIYIYIGDFWGIYWGYLQNYVFSRLKRIKFDRNILFPGSRSSKMGLSKLTISTLKACAPILENHKKVFFSHYQFYYQIWQEL